MTRVFKHFLQATKSWSGAIVPGVGGPTTLDEPSFSCLLAHSRTVHSTEVRGITSDVGATTKIDPHWQPPEGYAYWKRSSGRPWCLLEQMGKRSSRINLEKVRYSEF